MSTITLTVAPCDVADLKANPDLRFNAQVIERAAIQTALEHTRNNISEASRFLRIDRRTIQRITFWDTGMPKRGNRQPGKERTHATQKV